MRRVCAVSRNGSGRTSTELTTEHRGVRADPEGENQDAHSVFRGLRRRRRSEEDVLAQAVERGCILAHRGWRPDTGDSLRPVQVSFDGFYDVMPLIA